MDFEIKKLSDVGTSNPIIARLSMQTNDLVKMFPLTDKQKEDIFGLFGMKVSDRLVSCYKILSKLQDELNKVNQTDNSEYFKGNTVYTPIVMGLRYMCESFLYEAKSTLRDILGIFDIFFNKKFSEAHYNKAYEWAKEEFGVDDKLTKMLKDDHDSWIQEIIFKRNAVEHPGGRSGYINIDDIKLISKENPPYFEAPKWYRNNEKASPIHADIAVFIENTLELCEDLLVILLEKLPKGDLPLVIVEIPPEQRDPGCPVRLKVTLHLDYIHNKNQ
jgi:hypothetical protein